MSGSGSQCIRLRQSVRLLRLWLVTQWRNLYEIDMLPRPSLSLSLSLSLSQPADDFPRGRFAFPPDLEFPLPSFLSPSVLRTMQAGKSVNTI